MKGEPTILSAMARYIATPINGDTMASEACMSRFHYQRVFRQTVGEPPGGLRRRLVLERAAFDLRNTTHSVTEIAFEAGYQSLEGFSRAFKSAFGVSPATYRKSTRTITKLPGNSGVHYQGAHNAPSEGTKRNMDLTDRMIHGDYAAKQRILNVAKKLTDAQLDAPLAFRHNLMPFVEPERTLREALSRMAGGENGGWAGAMMQAAKWPITDNRYRHLSGDDVPTMATQLESFHANYAGFVAHVKENNLWDTEWVDETCDQPETFAYGDVIEATLTWGIAQRMVVQRLLEQMGLQPDNIK
jgi:AraC-like DNA-binding protein